MNKKSIVSIVSLIALTMGLPAVAAQGPGTVVGSSTSWVESPASLDEFANGLVAGCSATVATRELSHDELLELFPEYANTFGGPGGAAEAAAAVSGCNVCSCATCINVPGQGQACAACFTCCLDGFNCQARCEADLNSMKVVSDCTCTNSTSEADIRQV